MHFAELNPRPSQVVIHGKRYKLKPFSLAAHVWAYCEFATKDNSNGLEVLSKRFADPNDFDATYRTVYHLIKDKSAWSDYDMFLSDVTSIKNKYTLLMEFKLALQECVGNGTPDEPTEEEAELKKSVAAVM
jgi:hypothetical protein